MKLLAALGITSFAVLGLSGSFASIATARCAVVVGSAGSGIYNDSKCTEAGGIKEYVRVKPRGKVLEPGVECAEVENSNTETGAYTNDECFLTVGQRRYFKVLRAQVTLCSVHEEPCEAKNAVSTAHLQLAPGTVWLLETDIANISCSEVLAEVDLGALGSPQSVDLIALTFSGCGLDGGGSGCSISSEASEENPDELLLGKADLNFGDLEVLSGTVSVQCIGLMACTFEVEELLFEVQGAEGGSNGLVSIQEGSLIPSTGLFCPESEEISSESLEFSEDVYLVS
jgi:hypothetical protein